MFTLIFGKPKQEANTLTTLDKLNEVNWILMFQLGEGSSENAYREGYWDWEEIQKLNRRNTNRKKKSPRGVELIGFYIVWVLDHYYQEKLLAAPFFIIYFKVNCFSS